MSVYATFPGALSDRARHHLLDGLREWDKQGRPPIVLEEGGRLGVVGGLTFRAMLNEGPLDMFEFDLFIDSLDDIPEAFPYREGSYVRWIADDGGAMHTTSGGPCYQWRAG